MWWLLPWRQVIIYYVLLLSSDRNSYCLNSAESHDSKLLGIQQKCVTKETQCSHDCKEKGSPQECSHGDQASRDKSVKQQQMMPKGNKKRSVRHKKVHHIKLLLIYCVAVVASGYRWLYWLHWRRGVCLVITNVSTVAINDCST